MLNSEMLAHDKEELEQMKLLLQLRPELELPDGSSVANSRAGEECPIPMAASTTRDTLEEAKKAPSSFGEEEEVKKVEELVEEKKEDDGDGYLYTPTCPRHHRIGEEEVKKVEELNEEGKEDNDDCHTPTTSRYRIGEEEEAKKVELKEEENEDDKDDGYHTPASPCHRIPPPKQCPPPPRKPSLRQRPSRKRRERLRKIYRVVQRIDPSLNVEWIISVVEDNSGDPSKKKARE